jgi:hypothetical protein
MQQKISPITGAQATNIVSVSETRRASGLIHAAVFLCLKVSLLHRQGHIS